MEAGASCTSALGAVRRASKDARLNARFEVGGNVDRHLGKKTIARVAGRMDEGATHARVHQKLRKLLAEQRQFGGDEFAMVGRKHFGTLFADLRSVQANPDAVCFRPLIPE